MVTKHIYIDAWQPMDTVVRAVQGEASSRFLIAHIISNGAPVDLTSATVSFYGTKPDDTLIYNGCEILDAPNGIVSVALTQQMSSAVGEYKECGFNISLIDSILKVGGVSIVISEASEYDDAVESQDEFSALVSAINQVGHYTPTITQTSPETATFEFIASKSGMEKVPSQEIVLPVGPQGIQGLRGPMGEKGESYYLADYDKQDIANLIVDAPIVISPKYVDSISEMTDTSRLYIMPDGKIYAYVSGTPQEVFTDVLKDVGYTENTRVNSSGALVAWTTNASDVTGYIPCKVGDVFRLKNMSMPYPFTSNTYWSYVAAYDAEKNFIKKYRINENGDDADAVLEDNNIVQFTLKPTTVDAGVAYVVINAQEITDASEVYVNSTFVEVEEWTDTGISYIPHVDTSSVPDYWRAELQKKADEIQIAMEAAGRKKSAFLWYTDAHWQTNAKVSPSLLKYLQDNTPINKINFGGDIINDPSSFTHDKIQYAYEWRQRISSLRNHHSVPGNHDLNQNSTDVRDMAYAFLIAPEESSDMVFGDGMYYYIDNPAERTRYIYLDYMTNNHSAMMAQGQFIVDALNTSPDGWHIVVIAHRWFQYTSSTEPTVGTIPKYESEIMSVLDAYNARGTHTASNYFYAQDFADGKGKVEFCIGGHIHVDYDFTTPGGIPVILTASDTNQDRSPDETEDSGVVGTISESAVFGIIADYDNNKITIIGVGRGTSRDIF